MSNLFMLHERRPLNRYWMTCNEFQPVLKAQQSNNVKTEADSSDRSMLDEGPSLLKT